MRTSFTQPALPDKAESTWVARGFLIRPVGNNCYSSSMDYKICTEYYSGMFIDTKVCVARCCHDLNLLNHTMDDFVPIDYFLSLITGN